jgi:2'-5' RNA ligase
MRIFFAAWPPRATAHALGAWAREAERETGGKATAADKIHLTLAFLGEADPRRAANAARRVQGARHALPIEQAQYWPHNKIVWVGPREAPAVLTRLVEQLRLELYKAEFILERRPFAAHISLLRNARAPRTLPALPRLAWPVDEFVLVRSSISQKGSSYEIIERFALA